MATAPLLEPECTAGACNAPAFRRPLQAASPLAAAARVEVAEDNLLAAAARVEVAEDNLLVARQAEAERARVAWG